MVVVCFSCWISKRRWLKIEKESGSFMLIPNVFRHDIKDQYIGEFSDSHMLLLVYMQRYLTHGGSINFCMGWLFEDLNIKYRNTQIELINCLADLVSWNLLIVDDDINNSSVNKNTRIVAQLPGIDGRYTKLYDSEIVKILNVDEDIRVKKTMLYIYVVIASWIDDKGYCYPPYKYMKEDISTTSDNRINSALVLLKEHGLIDYDNVGQILVENKVKQGNNVYVICVNSNYKNKLATGLKNRRSEFREKEVKFFTTTISNRQRGVKQRLNNLWKKYNSNDINDSELKELEKLEHEYYNLIKTDNEKLSEVDFIFNVYL